MLKIIIYLILLIPVSVYSQPWLQNINLSDSDSSINFFTIQKAFNSYYDPLEVVNGKIIVKGEEKKVPGWKQFKRWEWFWESRVNRKTGLADFTKLDKYKIQQTTSKSLKSGTTSESGDWKTLGPSVSTGGYEGIGRINCIAFHPSDENTFWVGSPSGGLWVTNDAGANWKVLTDNNAVLGVSDIAVSSDFSVSGIIYIATGDRDGGSIWTTGGSSNDNNSIGILKSTNAGVTWETTGLSYAISQAKQIGRILINPDNNNILLAGTSDGIEKTTDGGLSWNRVYSGSYVIDMEYMPDDTNTIYASTNDYQGTVKIIKSTDGGVTWATIKEFAETDLRAEIAVTPDDASYLYVIVANRDGGLNGIYKSTDGGENFTQLVNGDDEGCAMLGYFSDGSGTNEGQGGYDLCIATSPLNRDIVLVGGVNTWKTTDGGSTWEICNMWTSHDYYNKSGAPEVHADKHNLTFRDDGILFECNDGGVYSSDNNGIDWSHITNGLVISQMYRIGVSQTDSTIVITGLQDNGTKLYSNATWFDVVGGDGMECIVDYTNKDIQYASYANGIIYRTDDMWSNQTTISDNITDNSGAWITPYVLSPDNNSVIYIGYADLWKSTDSGNSFTKISDINSTDLLRSIAVSPSNTEYIYIADFSHIWKTTNGGGTWSDITGSLPVTDNSITNITIKNSDSNTLWITMGGYDAQRVFETTDGGASWNNISTGLPEIPVMNIVQNKQNTSFDELYSATDVGVYVKLGDNAWQQFSEGLPNVVISELEIFYNNDNIDKSKLRAASFGRGLWETYVYKSSESAPVANFYVSNDTIFEGQTVTFYDSSLNSPAEWSWFFDGGTPSTSEIKNPEVTYLTQGSYNVSLVVNNSIGKDSIIKKEYIYVKPAVTPIAGFTATKNNIYEGQTVRYNDTSLNIPTTWEWYFIGGTPSFSTEQSPYVVYDSSGSYDVKLVAINTAGSDTIIKNGYINVKEPPEFPEPQYVEASAFIDSVTLVWQSPALKTFINEGFEQSQFPPTGWEIGHSEVIDSVQDIPDDSTWVHCDKNTFTTDGDQYIHNGLYSTAIGYDSPGYNWLITPEIELNTTSKLIFWLWYYNDIPSGYITKLHVMIDTAGVWTSLMSFDENSSNNEYQKPVVIPLQSFANTTVRIAFVYEYNDGFQLAIDDIFIGTTLSGYEIYRNNDLIKTEYDSTATSYREKLNTGEYDYYVKALYSAPDGISDTSNHSQVTVYGTVITEFTAEPNSGSIPLNVNFTNNTLNADTYLWDFGDGAVSSEESPKHTYTSRGEYTVSLTASNKDNEETITKNDYIKVTAGVVSSYFYGEPIEGVFPLQVAFVNKSENANEYKWDFGDGNYSYEVSPVHTYSKAGNYSVKLYAENEDFSDTLSKDNYITVLWPVPVAGFDAAPISGIDPLNVVFTDKSVNATSWHWNFGDGSVSEEQSPEHVFTKGIYTISLTVENPSGVDSKTEENLIIVDANSLEQVYKHKMKVYPNPVVDNLIIDIYNENYSSVEMWLYSSSGQLITNQKPKLNQIVRQQFDMSNFLAGTYLLKIKIDDSVLVVSIVKE